MCGGGFFSVIRNHEVESTRRSGAPLREIASIAGRCGYRYYDELILVHIWQVDLYVGYKRCILRQRCESCRSAQNSR